MFATEDEAAKFYDAGKRIRCRQLHVNFPVLHDGDHAPEGRAEPPAAEASSSAAWFVEKQADVASSYLGVRRNMGIKDRDRLWKATKER